MEFAEYTLSKFNDKLASDAPTPGGGSVAGLGTALSGALIEMVINLTDDEALQKKIPTVKEKREEALQLIDDDAESFNQVMAAFKMPKDSEEEKAKRTEAIQEALYGASLTPFDTMKVGLKLLKIARAIIGNCNPNAISDIGVAGLIGFASIKSANLNVMINTASLHDKEKAKEMEKEASAIIKEAKKITRELEEITEDEISS